MNVGCSFPQAEPGFDRAAIRDFVQAAVAFLDEGTKKMIRRAMLLQCPTAADKASHSRSCAAVGRMCAVRLGLVRLLHNTGNIFNDH